MTFGEKIVLLRKTKGMSQDQFAELLGVTRQSISKWERDEVMADTDRILAISHLFGVSCDYLLDDNINNAAFGKETPSTTTVPPIAQPPLNNPVKPNHWHWLGLIPMLWGLGDLLVIQQLFVGFFGMRITDLGVLFRAIPQILKYHPQGVLILVIFLLSLLFMLAKIALGLFLIIRGCKRNAKISQAPHR